MILEYIKKITQRLIDQFSGVWLINILEFVYDSSSTTPKTLTLTL